MLFKILLSIILLALSVAKWITGKRKKRLERQVNYFEGQKEVMDNLLSRGLVKEYEERKKIADDYNKQFKKATYLSEGVDEYLIWIGIIVSIVTIAFSLIDYISRFSCN